VAKGQLALSTTMQLAIKPDIIHVVSYCEADHAATPEEIIESCRLLRRVMQDSLIGLPDLASDPEIIARKEILIEEAKKLLHALEQIGETRGIVNPYSSPQVLTEIVRRGLWDAPQLKGSPIAKGEMRTKIIKGACVIVDSMGNPLLENERNILFLATKKGIHESS
jgi:hypothetical protein